MNMHKFTVKRSLREVADSTIWYVIFVALLISAIFLLDVTAFGVVVIGAMVLWMTMSMFSSVLFRVVVDHSAIEVRTKYGRKYQISCKEIEEIVCTMEQTTYQGVKFYITVAASKEQFSIMGRMQEFDTFAGYLLDKLSAGEIKASAATEKCIEDLEYYRQGVLAKKKTSNK